jgi:hypothetical protein
MARSLIVLVSSLAGGVRHWVIRGLAVMAMVAVVALNSLGSVGTYVLGVAGITSVTLGTTASPAAAQRWRRRVWRGRGRRRW